MSTEVREVPGRGRCLFAAAAIKQGETFLREIPCFVSRPDDRPAVLAALEGLHAQEAFGFGHVKSHLAAVLSYLSASPSAYGVILGRWAPRADDRLKPEELERVVAELTTRQLLCDSQVLPEGRAKEDLTPAVLQKLVIAWEYNGFSGCNDTLLMYDQISTASHSCDPNCDQIVLLGLFRSSHEPKASVASSGSSLTDVSSGKQASGVLRKGDVFERRHTGLAFRANRSLKQGDEITFSYCLTQDDLMQDFRHRRKQLNLRGWKFVCACPRCTQEVHDFLHPGRGTGTEEVEEKPEGDEDLYDLFAGI